MQRVIRFLVVVVILAAAVTAAVVVNGQEVVIRHGIRGDSFYNYFVDAAKKFAEENPGIRVQVEMLPSGIAYVEAILVQTAAGSTPDLIMANGEMFSQFASLGVYQSLDNYVKQSRLDLGRFFPTAIDELKLSGSLYAMPVMYHSGNAGLFYRPDFFAEAGITYPDDTWRYENEFLNAARKLNRWKKDDTIERWGIRGLEGYNPLVSVIHSYGGEILDRAGKQPLIDSPNAIRAVSFVRDLVLTHKVNPQPSIMATAFQTGAAAMTTGGPWLMGTLNRTLGPEKWAVAVMPMGPDGLRMPSEGAGAVFGISRHSQQPEAVWKWLQFLISDEQQRLIMASRENFSAMPRIVRDYLQDERLQPFLMALNEGQHRRVVVPANFRRQEMTEMINSGLKGIFRGDVAPEIGLVQIKEKLKVLLSQ